MAAGEHTHLPGCPGRKRNRPAPPSPLTIIGDQETVTGATQKPTWLLLTQFRFYGCPHNGIGPALTQWAVLYRAATKQDCVSHFDRCHHPAVVVQQANNVLSQVRNRFGLAPLGQNLVDQFAHQQSLNAEVAADGCRRRPMNVVRALWRILVQSTQVFVKKAQPSLISGLRQDLLKQTVDTHNAGVTAIQLLNLLAIQKTRLKLTDDIGQLITGLHPTPVQTRTRERFSLIRSATLLIFRRLRVSRACGLRANRPIWVSN